MKAHIAKCGYRCDLCPVFKTPLTQADKEDISRAFAQYFGYQVPPEQIKSCTGCQLMEQPMDKECFMFPCVRQKGISTCAECDDFACENLRQQMDAMDQCLAKHSDIPPGDFEKYIKPFLNRQTLTELRRSKGKSRP